MDSKGKFRNHISIIFEKLGAVSGAIIAFAIINVENIANLLKEGTRSELSLSFLIGTAVVIAILVVSLVYQLVIWSKTYIYVQDNSIVIEKNTLHKTKNTVGIRSISNVNIEQNLFEMFIGTCSLKLDTNSMSTADETDVKIVLKKNDAKELRKYLMTAMQDISERSKPLAEASSKIASDWMLEVSGKEMLSHGLLAVNVVSLLIAIGTFIALISMIVTGAEKVIRGESVVGMFFGLLMAGGMWVSAMRDLLKGFIKYYNFKITRRGDRLYMSYGLLKKVNYTIPVEKINALKLKQSLFARISGHYMAEIINIGMGDDEEETESFLFPYCRIETVAARITELIPEYDFAKELTYDRQPRSVWLAWIIPFSFYIAIVAALIGIGSNYFGEYFTWIIAAGALMILFGIIFLAAGFMIDGDRFGDEDILLVDGFLEKKYCFVLYRKIQFVEYIQNPFARLSGIQKARIYILASALNRAHDVAYFSSINQEFLKDKILTAHSVGRS